MKKIYIVSMIIFALSGAGYAAEILPVVHPGVYDAGAINARDMELRRQQDFRRQEYNDFKSIQEVKDEHEKELNETVLPERTMFEKIINRKSPPKFIEKDGQIKIEHVD